MTLTYKPSARGRRAEAALHDKHRARRATNRDKAAAAAKLSEAAQKKMAAKTINLAALWCDKCRRCHLSVKGADITCAECGGPVSERGP